MRLYFFVLLATLIVASAFGDDDCWELSETDKGGSIRPVTKLGLYLKNQKCWHNITQFTPAGLTFRFTKLDMEIDDTIRPCKDTYDTCDKQCTKNDHVIIYNYPELSEITRRCGSNMPSMTWRSPAAAAIYFKSDDNIQRSGFEIVYDVDPDTVPCKSTKLLQKTSGLVENYKRNSDGKYRSNEDCRWLIQVPSNYNAIRIFFNKLDIDGSCLGGASSCNCNDDFVDIIEGNSEDGRLVTRRCGGNIPGEFLVNGNNAYIRFKTNSVSEKTGFQIQFAASNVPVTVTTTPSTPSSPWPRGDVLDGFWPMDAKNGLKDLSPMAKHCTSNCNGQLDTEVPGPFGYQYTSHNNQKSKGIMSVSDVRPEVSAPITISMFVKTQMGMTGNLVKFYNSIGQTALEISVENNEVPLRLYSVAGVDTRIPGLRDDVWTFLSFAIDNQTCTMNVYGQFGLMHQSSYNQAYCDILQFMSNIDVGTNLATNASLACVSVHSDVLSYKDVSRLHEACRQAQGSSECGSPKLPLSPIPNTQSTMPTYGQFPWAASLRVTTDSSYVCTAAILDHRHLLTAARCFKKYNNPMSFYAHVGDHDLSYVEAGEQAIQVEKIILHPENGFYQIAMDGDIAIVRLTRSIDFNSDYINSICLPKEASTYEILDDSETYYVFGWGKNGRNALTSPSLARYLPGYVLPKADCEELYAFNGICFQTSNGAYLNAPCDGDEGALLLKAAGTVLGDQTRLVPVSPLLFQSLIFR